jgi:hypothetical protein
MNPEDEAHMTAFINGAPLADKQEAVELLCLLQAEVSGSKVTRFPDVAADCFCGEIDRRHPGWMWRNDGESLRYIFKIVLGHLQLVKQYPDLLSIDSGEPTQ